MVVEASLVPLGRREQVPPPILPATNVGRTSSKPEAPTFIGWFLLLSLFFIWVHWWRFLHAGKGILLSKAGRLSTAREPFPPCRCSSSESSAPTETDPIFPPASPAGRRFLIGSSFAAGWSVYIFIFHNWLVSVLFPPKWGSRFCIWTWTFGRFPRCTFLASCIIEYLW